MSKVLALNTNGDMTYCTCPPEMRGKGRCNHIAHQEVGETTAEFLARAETIEIQKPKPLIPEGDVLVTSKPLRFTPDQLKDMEQVRNRFQLDLESDKEQYIELGEPLWNDMDKNYFAQQTGFSVKNINSVISGESFAVLESNGACRVKENSVITRERANIILGIDNPEESHLSDDEIKDQLSALDIHVDTRVTGMNKFAKKFDFQATKQVYVLPYHMRQGVPNEDDDLIDSDLTAAYKYMLRTRANPDRQQIAYSALLDNSSLSKENARYNSGFKNKSLADEFAGKGGVFRAVLSGCSVPYSGRAVITPSTKIKFGEIAIPPSSAVDIFKPTIIKYLAEKGCDDEEIDYFFKKFRGKQNTIARDDLDELEHIIAHKRVIMNRQPSLHVSSLQSFKPRISNTATVQIRPEYCKGYGADFDGDTVSFYGINQEQIIPVVDRQLDAHNYENTRVPRHLEDSAILPSKDGLWGLLNILDKRSN